MMPEVWIHSMVSIDGRITGFTADLGLYYGTAAQGGYDAALIGSGTVLAINEDVPPEEEADRKGKDGGPEVPYMVLVDSGGKVRTHHLFRRQEYIREVIVLVTKKTPKGYIRYLEEREIPHLIAGSDRVDMKKAFAMLNERYGISRIRTDAGGTLNSLLLKEGLVDEMSLLVVPQLVGNGHPGLFDTLGLDKVRDMKLIEQTIHPGGVVQLRYSLKKG